METKIVLVLTVVALSIGCCQGITIYDDEYEKVYTKEKLDRRLTSSESKLNAREVAGLLAKAINKDEALEASKGIKIRALLDIAEPIAICRLAEFVRYEEWRKLFSGPDGNANLLEYVNKHMERLFNICANDMDKVFEMASSTFSREGDYSRQITEYVETMGEESDSQEKTVTDFLAAKILSDNQERELIQGCAALETRVMESLSYFIKDDKKISDFLDNLGDTEEALVYKRCKAVNQTFGKQNIKWAGAGKNRTSAPMRLPSRDARCLSTVCT